MFILLVFSVFKRSESEIDRERGRLTKRSMQTTAGSASENERDRE